MKKPEIVVVKLGNGDSALYLNGQVVHALESWEPGLAPADLAASIAAPLGVAPRIVEMEVPKDDDWGWADVAELLPTFDKQPDIVPVANWNSEAYVGEGGLPGTEKPYLIEISDLREASGQVFIDVAPESGMAELAAAVNVEIHRLDGIDGDMPCVHLHFDESNLAASFFKQGDRFIVRPETDVTIRDTVLGTGERVWILE